MNNGVAIIAFILLLFCVLPIFLVGRNTRKKNKKRLKEITDIAEKSGGKLSEYDLWNGAAIGIDHENQKLFFAKEVNGNNEIVTIKLRDLQKCRVQKTNHPLDKNSTEHPMVQKIELCFVYTNAQQPEDVCPFYSSEQTNLAANQQQKLAEKWVGIVSSAILGKKSSK